jgi:hypothetical protein
MVSTDNGKIIRDDYRMEDVCLSQPRIILVTIDPS